MASVGAYEAKTKLSELLKRVEQGEHITITKHGTPVAVLVPVGRYPRRDVAQTIAEIKESAKGNSLKGMSLQELIDEGRRH